MAIKIDIGLNINKSLEGAFDKLVKETEKKLGGISKQAKSASESLNDLFSGSKAKADAFIASLSKVEGVEGINTIIESFKGLKQALTDGSITTETYYAEISKLTDQFTKLASQADVAGKKVTGVGGLDQKTIGNIKGGVITKTDIQNLDVPQLQQSLVILENQVQTERLKGKALRENRDVQEMIKKQLKDMNLSTQQKLIQDQKALDIANKQLAAQRKANATDQLTFAKSLSVGSINEMKAKVQELTIARGNMNATTAAEQKEVRAVNKEIQELTKRYKQLETAGTDLAKKNDKTSDTFRKLGTMAATYFSVYAVKNFVKEIAMVTGEFDIQRRSLAALIQNKAAADEIFERIKQTALRSPFSVMELTTYTKQLAAYRVETEQLYDTTYRLADISAGLGVDMSRLILAFGQVKAASVLRGTELRQFTESGIPLIQLLAEKFTELEKRTVSTGEVFDKISNRLVPFKMIDEIFKDMTKSGGAFYEMQKIQSETIKGRLVNLTDAYQIMLDKIGSGGTGNFLLKGVIGSIELLLKNFDSLAAAIITTGSAIAVFKSVAFFATVELNMLSKAMSLAKAISIAFSGVLKLQKNATIAASAANIGLTGSFAKLIAANPYAAVIAGVVALGIGIYSVVRAQGAFNREIKKIETEGLGEFNTLVKTYERLAKVIKDTTKSAAEQKDAYDELKRTFKDILPDKMLEIDYLKQTSDGYNAVRTAIYNSIKARVDEQKMTKLQDKYKGIAKDEVELNRTIQKLFDTTEADAQGIVDELKKISEGTSKFKNFGDLFKNLFDINVSQKYSGLSNDIVSLLNEYKKFNTELSEITNNTFKSLSKSYIEFGNDFKNIGKKLQESLKNDFAIISDPLTANVTAQEFDRSYKSVVNYYRATIKKAQDMTFTDDIGNANRDAFVAQMESELKVFQGNARITRDMVKDIGYIAKEYKINSAPLMKYLRTEDQGLGDWLEARENDIKGREALIKQYYAADEGNRFSIIENIKVYEAETKALSRLVESWGKTNDAKGGGSTENPVLKAIKEEISLIETLTKRYEDLRKAGATDADAKQTTAKEYAQNIKNVQAILAKQGIQFDFESMIGDKDALTKALQAQIDRFANNPSVQKELSEAFGKIGIDVKINNLESIQREINEELEKLKQRRSISLEINQAPSSVRPVLMSLFGIEEKDMLTEIGSLMDAANAILVKGLTDAKINSDIKDFATITKEQFFEILAPLTDGKGFSAIGKELLDVFEFIQSENQNYVKQSVSAYAELLKKYADFNDQLIEVAYNKDKELKNLDEMYILSKKQIEEDLMNGSIKDEETYYKKLKQNLENYYKFKLAILNKEKKETARIKYEELKESDDYINMFDRVGIMSEGNMIDAYTKVRQGIVDAFKSGTISLKEFKRSLEELDNQFNEFYKNTTLFGSYLSKGLDGVVKQLQDNAYQVQAIASDIEKMQDTQDPVKFRAMLGEDKIEYLKKQGIDVMSLFKQSNGQMSQIGSKVAAAGKGMSGMANKMMQTFNIIDIIVTNIYNGIKATKQVIDDIIRLREAYGKSDEKTTTDFEKWATVISNTNEKVMSSWSKFKSGDPVGALADAISQVLGVFSDLAEIGDKQVQEEIEKTIEATDRLRVSVDRLNDAVEEQMGSEWIQNMQKIADLQNQIAANTQSNIDAEKSRKDPDDSLIKEWEQDLYDAEKAATDATNAIVEELMGGSVKDMAEELGDIFVSAFMRGEDAIEEMKETFNKMIQNMIVKSIVSTIIGKRLEAITKQLTASIDNDGVLSEDEILGLAGLSEEVLAGLGTDLEAIKPFLERIREILGIGGALGETLQKGIKGITEQTASAIESYLNTLRYEVFKHTNLLTSIARDVALSRDIQSSILIQAQQHYQISLGIKQLIESVTMNNGSGVGFRTYSY